ncbi:MAG: hypothetical protein WC595_06560 [Candidatus Nanoarchaeia archaeon]
MRRNYSPSQVGAMVRSREVALELKECYGEQILRDRRAKMTYEQIIEKNLFADQYPKMGFGGLIAAVHYVLNGYKNKEGSFEGLMNKEEAKAIRVGNIKRYSYPVSLGCIPSERRVQIASKAGEVSYKNGVGIHGRAKDVAIEDRKKGGRNSVLSRGLHPWCEGESLLAYVLNRSGVYDNEGVCSKVNKLWKNGRSVQAVKNQLSRFRKNYHGLSEFLR